MCVSGPVALRSENALDVFAPIDFGNSFTLNMYLRPAPSAGAASARFDKALRCDRACVYVTVTVTVTVSVTVTVRVCV